MTWIRSRISFLLYRNGRGIVVSEVRKLLKSYAHSDVLAVLDISLHPWAEHREFRYNRNASFSRQPGVALAVLAGENRTKVVQGTHAFLARPELAHRRRVTAAARP